jgi:hypothetical protein
MDHFGIQEMADNAKETMENSPPDVLRNMARCVDGSDRYE